MNAQDETPHPGYYARVAPAPPEGDVDLLELAQGRRPIEVEVGFGRGMSLLERAHVIPEGLLLGIEIKSKWAYRVARRCEDQGLPQVRVWAGDARQILPRLGPDGVVDRWFVHFPDPWWKKRHAKRRIIDEAMLDQVARLLAPGGELFIQTDVEERARLYHERLTTHPALVLQGEKGWLDHNPYQARSNREKRAEEDGLPVYRLLARRRAT